MKNEIIGVDINKYPRFYKSIDRVMVLYHINKIFVDLCDESCRGRKIFLGITPGRTMGLILLFKKNITTTKPTVEFIENNLSDDEIDSLIGHELGHLKNYDITKINTPLIILKILLMIGSLATLYYALLDSLLYKRLIDSVLIESIVMFIYIPLYIIIVKLYVAYVCPTIIRRHQLQADLESLQHVKKPDSLKSALKKFIEKQETNKEYINKQIDPIELRLKIIDEYKLK